MSEAITIGDALRAATERAVTLLEKLDQENETMRSASTGILPDGTPVEDMLAELKDAKAQIASFNGLVRQIRSATLGKAADASKAIKAIRELVENHRKL